MGQQQLLLLVLGIVIVGLAVVAGINAFDENQRKSAEDALTNEGFRLASNAKAWYGKPTQYAGGGNDPTSLGNITWDHLGVEASSLNADNNYETPWGEISMAGDGSGGTVTFTLSLSDGSNAGVVVFEPGASSGNEIQYTP